MNSVYLHSVLDSIIVSIYFPQCIFELVTCLSGIREFGLVWATTSGQPLSRKKKCRWRWRHLAAGSLNGRGKIPFGYWMFLFSFFFQISGFWSAPHCVALSCGMPRPNHPVETIFGSSDTHRWAGKAEQSAEWEMSSVSNCLHCASCELLYGPACDHAPNPHISTDFPPHFPAREKKTRHKNFTCWFFRAPHYPSSSSVFWWIVLRSTEIDETLSLN